MPIEATFAARVDRLHDQAVSQIVSVDVETGARIEHTTGPGLKVSPQFVGADRVGYLVKAGDKGTLRYTDGATVALTGRVRAPSWSPDGRRVVFERTDVAPRPQNQRLHGWLCGVDYRYTDIFPSGRRSTTASCSRGAGRAASTSTPSRPTGPASRRSPTRPATTPTRPGARTGAR